MIACPLCETVQRCIAKQEATLIYEFEDAYWLLGRCQFYRGYTLLLAKEHIREWHEFPLEKNLLLQKQLMTIAKFIDHHCVPHKLNYACFGNVVPHHHIHIVPRYLSDPQHKAAPDLNSDNFPQDCWPVEKLLQEAQRLREEFLIFSQNQKP